MHKVVLASLLLLASTALAGCTDDDVEPVTDADEPASGTYVGPQTHRLLGTFTWGDDQQGVGAARLNVPIASLELPDNITRIHVDASREHNGFERQGAHLRLDLRGAGDASAMFPPQVTTFGGSSSLDVSAIATGAILATIEYEYDTQLPSVTHNLELRITGEFPRTPANA